MIDILIIIIINKDSLVTLYYDGEGEKSNEARVE